MTKQHINKYWSGPVPYNISQSNSFYGRDEELEQFLNMIYDSNLSLLTGASGVGKSSFLYAGIIPRIKNTYGNVPIFLVKNWHSGIFDEISVLEAIKEDIKTNADDEESKGLLSHLDGDEDANVYSRLKKTTDKGEGWGILILDQFEEIIRSGFKNANHILGVISKFIRNVKQISIIISFREEHYIAFKDFEGQFGGISNHTLQLKPITKENCKKQILEKVCPIIEKELEISIILSNNDLDDLENANKKNLFDVILEDCIINKTDELGQEKQNDIDLLALQAVMEDIYKSAFEKKATIDLSFYNTYNDKKIKDLGINKDLGNTVNKSLYIWFNDTITKGIDSLDDEKKQILGKDIAPAVFYFIVEICPFLASEGYKKNWSQSELAKRLIGDEDYKLLSMHDFDEKEFSDIHKKLVRYSGKVGVILKESIFSDKEIIKIENISKFADDLKEYLYFSFNKAIDILQKQKILKTTLISGEKSCSIRHDKLGVVAEIWAKRNKCDFKYVEQSFKNIGALDIPLHLHNSFDKKNLKFRASYFFPKESGSGKVNVKSIDFKECDFTASVFEGIYFKNCKFIDSNLEGVVFMDCTFNKVVFDNCIFKGSLFKSRQLNNSPGVRIEEGGLKLDKCDVLISEFSDLLLVGNFTISTEESKAENKNNPRYTYDNKSKQLREKEFSLSSIRLKKEFDHIGIIEFLNDIKSNNLMIDKKSLTSASFESTKINGMSLLGG